MHITRNPNIQFKQNIHRNGTEISPFMGEFLGRRANGPCRKNLVIPIELATKLIIKESKGRAWLKFSKVGIVQPPEVLG